MTPDNKPSSLEQYAGHYTVEAEIGRGGTGRVFLAYDGNIGREVAIKELDTERARDDTVREKWSRRFVREAKITGQMEHPSVVPVYDFGKRPDGTTYYVMKYVRGKSMGQAIKECECGIPEMALRGRLKLMDALIDVCDAMGYAHAKGVIHRDLKPANIVMGEFGETIILDWGLAKKKVDEDVAVEEDFELAGTGDAEITRHGAILGTPSYMAPEQADQKFGEVDQQSDVYALGTILFMLLTGHKIYEPGGKEAIAQLISDDPTPSPHRFSRDLPPELVAICEKATAKNKEERFADAREMAGELRAYRDGRLVSVYAYSRGELFRRFLSRNRAGVLAALAVIVTVIIGAGFSINYAVDANRARQKAERALVDISNISEEAMTLARDAAETLKPYVDTFSKGMLGATKRLSRLPLNRPRRLMPVLEALSEEFANISSFAIILPSLDIAATFPRDFETKLDDAMLIGERVDKVFEQRSVLLGNAMVVDGVHMFAISVPIIRGGKVQAVLSSFIKISDIMPAAFGFNPVDSPFQVWCMQDDGYILYDEDPAQIGKELFTDAMYEKFPELLKFGKRMQEEPWGMGYYEFFDKVGEKVIYKIAAWDTVKFSENVSWKMVVTHPYIVEK